MIDAPAPVATPYIAPDGRTFPQLIAAHVVPDPVVTPGVVNPAVTPETIRATICVSGWTKTVRPSTGYTDKLRAADVIPGHKAQEFELDHRLSIIDGGSPTDPKNLWDQVYRDRYGARTKDRVETFLGRAVCKNKITLAQAQAALLGNWLVAYRTYIGPLPK